MQTRLILLFLFFRLSVFAQVTIGVDEAPLTGSLLQLKNIAKVEGNKPNASKGLLLPRVSIKNVTSIVDIPNGNSEELVGLVVYNIHETDPACDEYIYKKGIFYGMVVSGIR